MLKPIINSMAFNVLKFSICGKTIIENNLYNTSFK